MPDHPGTSRPAGRRLARLIASVGGVGFCPVAPGTAGSLVALPLGAALLRRPAALFAVATTVSVAGIPAVRRAGNGADHGWIVIDEVAGTLLTLLGLCSLPGLPAPAGRARQAGVLAAFAIFRALDIAKPGPVGRLDRRHDAVGVMADDIAAGLLGAAALLGGRVALRLLAPRTTRP
ncbi:MAG: phosphatidylglycerophosphatase A [Gluconacetobacter diazotrophicus]|nr:phosphatidylglycerophosphatase A [Gluconacetobacter diazotrophicus]